MKDRFEIKLIDLPRIILLLTGISGLIVYLILAITIRNIPPLIVYLNALIIIPFLPICLLVTLSRSKFIIIDEQEIIIYQKIKVSLDSIKSINFSRTVLLQSLKIKTNYKAYELLSFRWGAKSKDFKKLADLLLALSADNNKITKSYLSSPKTKLKSRTRKLFLIILASIIIIVFIALLNLMIKRHFEIAEIITGLTAFFIFSSIAFVRLYISLD
jgi:hypothetical protein